MQHQTTWNQNVRWKLIGIIVFAFTLFIINFSVKVNAATTYGDSNVTATDLRNGSTKTFDGDDGRPAVLVFGGFPSCGNSTSAVKSLSKLITGIDDSVDFFVFNIISGNSDSTVVEWANSNEISSRICFGTTVGNSANYTLYSRARAYIRQYSDSNTMPFIVYVDGTGNVVRYSTAAQSKSDIKSNIEALGVSVNTVPDFQVGVTGNKNYDCAYRILEKVNQERTSRGLNSLSMDERLLSAAMLRAAECSISYNSGHIRPNGDGCTTVDSKVRGENIAYIYNSRGLSSEEYATQVMTNWMNSDGHRANILREGFTSIGVGVFLVNGCCYFSQDFGTEPAQYVGQPANQDNVSYTIDASYDQTITGAKFNSSNMRVGEEQTITRIVYPTTQSYSITTPVSGNYSVDITSSNTDVITAVDNNKIKAVGEGQARITIATSRMSSSSTINVRGYVEPEHNEPEYSEPTNPTNPTNSTNGLVQASDGNWYLYSNGNINYSYNGLYNDATHGWWLVENGKVNFNYSDLYCDSNVGWWKVSAGAVDFGYTDLYCSPSCGWWKVSGGRVDFGYTDLYCSPSCGWWKVNGGSVDFGYTDLYDSPSCGWWKVSGGRVDFDYTDLYNSPSCGWWKVNGGSVDFGYTDLYNSPSCGWWKVNGGSVDFGYTDLYNSPSCGWWKIYGGSVDFGYTDLYNSPSCGWWKVYGGAVDFGYTDLYDSPSCGWWKVNGGSVDFGYTDLYNSPSCGWWKVNGGSVDFGYTDLYDSPSCGWWKVYGGSVDFGYTGWYGSPRYGNWYVEGGRVIF